MKNKYAEIRGNKIFLRSFFNYPERQIGEVKEAKEASIEYFENKFEIFVEKVDKLEAQIKEAQNKGSYLAKLLFFKKLVGEYNGLGDFHALLKRLEKQESFLNEIISNNKERNLEIKESLLESAKRLSTQTFIGWEEITQKYEYIDQSWLKTGSVHKQHQGIEEEFKNLISAFFDKKKELINYRKRLIQTRIDYYEDIAKEAERLAKSSNPVASFKRLKELQKKWRQGQEIPSKVFGAIWRKFKKRSDIIFKKFVRFKNADNAKEEDGA